MYFEKALDQEDYSASFPLLGTGQQKLPKDQVAIETLKLTLKLSRDNLSSFNIFVYDPDSMDAINQHINEFMNLEEVNANDLIFGSVKIMVNRLCEIKNKQNTVFQKLNELISAPYLNISSIAIFGRKICEQFAIGLLNHYDINDDNVYTLNKKLNKITSYLIKDKFHQVVSHLRLLQSYGNIAAHQINHNMNIEDALTICISMKRIYDHFVNQEIKTGEFKV